MSDIKDIDKYAQDCYDSFAYFYRELVWPLLNGNTLVEPEHLIDLMCEHGEAFFYKKHRKKLVSIAPRNGKTTLFTIALPLWIWLRDPTRDIITISASEAVITDFYSDSNKLRQSDLYKYIWAFHHGTENTKLATSGIFLTENGAGGKHYQWTMLNTRVGIGGDYVIVDDPLLVKEANNANYCEKVAREYERGTTGRRHDKKLGFESPIMVVAQRLAVNDLIGVLLKGGQYDYLELQAIAEEDQTFVFPMSGRVWERPMGNVMNPGREDLATLQMIRTENSDFNSQWQCRPRAVDGALIEHDQIKFFDRMLPEYEKIIISVDCAATTNANSSNWGFLVLGSHGEGNFDILFCHAAKYLYPAGKKKLFSFIDEWNPDEVVIEAKSTGLALIPEVTGKYGTAFKMTSVEPGSKSKESRAYNAIPLILRYVRFPNVNKLPHCVWISLMLYEILSFPNSATMDLFDCLVQVLTLYHTGARKKSSTRSFYGLK